MGVALIEDGSPPMLLKDHVQNFKTFCAGFLGRFDFKNLPQFAGRALLRPAEFFRKMCFSPAPYILEQFGQQRCRQEMNRNVPCVLALRQLIAWESEVKVIAEIVNANVFHIIWGCLANPKSLSEAQIAKYRTLTTPARTCYHDVVATLDFVQSRTNRNI